MMREADCIFRGFTGSFSPEVAPTAAGASIKTRALKCTTKKHEKPKGVVVVVVVVVVVLMRHGSHSSR